MQGVALLSRRRGAPQEGRCACPVPLPCPARPCLPLPSGAAPPLRPHKLSPCVREVVPAAGGRGAAPFSDGGGPPLPPSRAADPGRPRHGPGPGARRGAAAAAAAGAAAVPARRAGERGWKEVLQWAMWRT